GPFVRPTVPVPRVPSGGEQVRADPAGQPGAPARHRCRPGGRPPQDRGRLGVAGPGVRAGRTIRRVRADTIGLAPPLAAFRAACPLLDRVVYLANCSQGPLAEPVRQALGRWQASWSELGMHWAGWVEEVDAARAAFAALIGASAEDVAVGTSVSQLTSSVASALVSRPDGWNGRTRIVSSTLEFPGVGQAWEATSRFGWRVERVDVTVEDALTADHL